MSVPPSLPRSPTPLPVPPGCVLLDMAGNNIFECAIKPPLPPPSGGGDTWLYQEMGVGRLFYLVVQSPESPTVPV